VDISGQVLSVVGRNVNVTKGRNPGPATVYDIVFSDGNTWTTWKADKATEAMKLQQSGALADLRGEVTVNGEFTNYKLLEIAPTGQLAAAVIVVLTPNGTTSLATTGAAIPIAPTSSGGMSPERESKIVKQSCLSTAFNFAGSLGYTDDLPSFTDVVDAALDLANTLYAEVYGQQNVAQSPTEVAAQVIQVIPEAVSVGAGTPDW
jgi:muconolactone delta-isomerase